MFQYNATPKTKFRIPVSSPDGLKKFLVRWPTDEEFDQRMRRMKVLRTNIGRDKHTSDIPNRHDADLELFEKILCGDNPQYDKYEASRAIERLDECSVESVTRGADSYTISMKVMSDLAVSATLGIPSQKDVAEYEASSLHLIGAKRTTELIAALLPAGVLFDKYARTSEGYAGAIPINHKQAAVRELLEQLDKVAAEAEIEIEGE